MVIEDNNQGPINNNSTNVDLTQVSSSSSSYPSSPLSYSDAGSAIMHWESITHIKLSKGLKRIARVAYNKHFKENKGLIKQDLIDLGYKDTYAKKILFECQKCKLLIPLDGYKQGRFKEYFFVYGDRKVSR
jgi:hypothetical protein